MNRKLFLCCHILLLSAITCSSHYVRAQQLSLDWAKSLGGTSSESSNALVTDSSGNVYITGSFRDSVDFDPGPGVFTMVANGSVDAFVLKLDVSGNLVWAKQFGGSRTGFFGIPGETGSDITIDPFGDILVAGLFGDTTDFDPGPETFELIANPGLGDAFVLKLDTAGNFIWVKTVGGSGLDKAFALCTDVEGNIFVTGRFQQTVDFDPGAGSFPLTTASSMDLFTLKLDVAGNFAWAVQHYVSGVSDVRDITVDNLGHVYVAGYTRVYPAPGANWEGSGPAMTIWKLHADSGNNVWIYQTNNVADPNDRPNAIYWDPNGYLYVCGLFSGEVNFSVNSELGFDTATSAGLSDIFVLKMDSSANIIWYKTMGAAGDDEATDITLDASGNVYVTGLFSELVDFDPASGVMNLDATGNDRDAFILKLDSAGHALLTLGMGTPAWDAGNAIAVGQHGDVYTTGYFGGIQGSLGSGDFDPGPDVATLTSNGSYDIFVQKFSCQDTSSITLTDTACVSYTLNEETYTESGTYTQVRTNAAGCDSVIHLQLTIAVPDPVITIDEFELGTTLPYATYQWLLHNTAIAGATTATYTVSQNGDYTVAVTNAHGCADTSDIYIVDNVGIEDVHRLAGQVSMYPNPAHDQVFIQAPIAVDVILSGIDGRVMRRITDARSFSVADLAAGVYLLRITDKDGAFVKVEKLVKQNK